MRSQVISRRGEELLPGLIRGRGRRLGIENIQTSMRNHEHQSEIFNDTPQLDQAELDGVEHPMFWRETYLIDNGHNQRLP